MSEGFLHEFVTGSREFYWDYIPLVQVTPTALAHGTRQPVICADVVCMLDAALDDSACMLSPYKVLP